MGSVMNKIIVFLGLGYSIALLIGLIFLKNTIIYTDVFVCMYTCVMLINALLKSQKHKKLLLVLSFAYLVLTIMSTLYSLFVMPKYGMITFVITMLLIIFQPIAFYLSYTLGKRDIKKY